MSEIPTNVEVRLSTGTATPSAFLRGAPRRRLVHNGAVLSRLPTLGGLFAVTLTAMPIKLRDVIESDFPIFIEHQCDPISARMAAFGAKDPDRDGLAGRWKKSLGDASTTQKAIVVGGTVVGFVASFMREGQLEVTYWIARTHWGRGIATAALSQLLQSVTTRPIYASAAKDNIGSLRVLANCGFVVRGWGRAFANARGEDIDEVFLELP